MRSIFLNPLRSWCGLGLALALVQAHAQDPSIDAAKKVLNDYKDTVVGVVVISKVETSYGGSARSREQKNEALGTVVDASGLVVAALSSVDAGGGFFFGGGDYSTSANVKESRVVLQDGTEIPAEMVMSDSDLDLAFFRVKMDSKQAKGIALKGLDLGKTAKVSPGDEVVCLSRCPQAFNREAAVASAQVNAATRKPREYLRVDGATLGCPVFSLSGGVVGICVTRPAKGQYSPPVVLPAADVQEIAQLAKSAKAGAKDK